MKKYKTGFVAGHFNVFHAGHLTLFKGAKEHCEWLVVGVFQSVGNDALVELPLSERAAIIKAIRYVDDVIILNETDDFIRGAWNELRFDCYFTTDKMANDSETQNIQTWLHERGSTVLLLPFIHGHSMEELKKKAHDMKVFTFGAGKRFDSYMRRKGTAHPPAFVFDNDPEKWGKVINGIMVKPPSELPLLMGKGGKLLITCVDTQGVKAQLEGMGINEYYIPW